MVLPGDKSLSHRALLLALLSPEPVRLTGLAPSADVASTLHAIEALGARLDRHESADEVPQECTVHGVGYANLAGRVATIDAGNAGTLARLLIGIAAAVPADITITGDASLSTRPMSRISVPLRAMGADIELAQGETLPARIRGSAELSAFEYNMPVASAQVQGALLLAALRATGTCEVTEPAPIRDHTERMLRRAGAAIRRNGRSVSIDPIESIQLPDTQIAADMSSAAPLMAAAVILPASFIRLPAVGVNPGRTGFLEMLERMGARTTMLGRAMVSGEPVADIEVHSSELRRITLQDQDIATAIDELPIYALVAHMCKGETVVRNAEELRVKESDRIAALVRALRAIGIAAEERPDGFVVRGSGRRPEGGTINAEGDHRIAMLGGIAGLVSARGVTIEDADCVDVSFPGFFHVIESLAVR